MQDDVTLVIDAGELLAEGHGPNEHHVVPKEYGNDAVSTIQRALRGSHLQFAHSIDNYTITLRFTDAKARDRAREILFLNKLFPATAFVHPTTVPPQPVA